MPLPRDHRQVPRRRRAVAAVIDCAVSHARQKDDTVEEAGPGQPNGVFPAAHVQLHELAQDQLAEAPRETMARQVLRWSRMAARPHPAPSMREVEKEGPGVAMLPPPASHVPPVLSRRVDWRLPLSERRDLGRWLGHFLRWPLHGVWDCRLSLKAPSLSQVSSPCSRFQRPSPFSSGLLSTVPSTTVPAPP